jgi:hypothetical protein
MNKHDFALSALGDVHSRLALGRWPRLLHFAPLALKKNPYVNVNLLHSRALTKQRLRLNDVKWAKNEPGDFRY